MALENPFLNFPRGDYFESLLPDFVLAFAFFTALVYAVLAKRFERQRPAIVLSAAMGLALSIGLVWWEQRMDLSVRDLGPLAVGFAVIILAAIMYQAIRQVGGSWAGVGIALGASLLVSSILGMPWPLASEIIQTVMTVALVVGILAFLMHQRGHAVRFPTRVRELPSVRRDMSDLYRNHLLSNRLAKGLRHLKQEADLVREHPREAEDVLLQLKRMLPAEGWLTERLAGLRARAFRVRQGHVARIEEIQHLVKDLPPETKRKAGEELKDTYKELGLDLRLERLDGAVAANEKRIRDLTGLAEQYAAAHDHRRLHGILEAAGKLQKHNSRLFQIIDRTEKRLAKAAEKVAKDARGVNAG
ncbi:MAG: hypothetical protein WBD44_07175 [Phycisphaerae bacterium]